jgi:hypothetical protein
MIVSGDIIIPHRKQEAEDAGINGGRALARSLRATERQSMLAKQRQRQ